MKKPGALPSSFTVRDAFRRPDAHLNTAFRLWRRNPITYGHTGR